MSKLKNKHILLGITGGIAAYKSAELLRLLKEKEADVRVVMTPSSEVFVGPLTFQALSGHPVYTEIFAAQSDAAMDHIELARWADMIVVAPATADFIARLTHGRADDLLTTICLATTAQIVIAPAMNQQMWLDPATQANIQLLQDRKLLCFGPGEGQQACGEVGLGRMLEPEELLEKITAQFQEKRLEGKSVLVTAGPTHEAIDPVRYLTNHSTGRMGYALAEAAALAGAKVCLVSGPSNLEAPVGVERISVITANEMYKAVIERAPHYDIFIAAAAVSDYRVETVETKKIKKTENNLQLQLVRNPDILASVTQLPNPPFTMGFAAETNDVLVNAQEKLQRKHMDMIVANRVGNNIGFGASETKTTLFTRSGETIEFPQMQKMQLATQLVERIIKAIFETA